VGGSGPQAPRCTCIAIGLPSGALEAVSGYRGVTASELVEFATWSKDPGLRAMGLELQLEQLPPIEARDYALEQVRDSWPRERLVAAVYLARSADPDTLVTLGRMSEDEDPEKSWAPAVALALTGDDAPLWRWANSVTLSYARDGTWFDLNNLVEMAVLWEHPATLSVLGALSSTTALAKASDPADQQE